jgi:hypothetical protein
MRPEHASYLVRKYNATNELPPDWDTLADVYFQQRSFLEHNENYNPCRQRYYIAFLNGEAKSAAVMYTIPIDMLTFSNIHSPVRMQVIGIPASVSPPGIFGSKPAIDFLISYLLKTEKGLILGLNVSTRTPTGKAIALRMLPTLELSHSFFSREDYLAQLRSSYRRRCLHIADKWKFIDAVQSSCAVFTNRHYDLYLEVLKHSTTKLETLSKKYFETLPGNFSLTTYFQDEEILCWHIICRSEAENRLYFFFGGHDYRFNEKQDAYFNNLLGVLQEGIDERFPVIDFGQTAEIPKMKLGAEIIPKTMFLYHSNPILLFILKMCKGLLEYRKHLPTTHVFRITHRVKPEKIGL